MSELTLLVRKNAPANGGGFIALAQGQAGLECYALTAAEALRQLRAVLTQKPEAAPVLTLD